MARGRRLGGAEPGALHHAAAAGDGQRVRELLTAGADVNQPAVPLYETPLHMAARQGPVGVVEALLAAGAGPEARNIWGCTPLMVAARHGQVACVQLLLTSGADTKAEDENGWSCLHHWAQWASEHPDSDNTLQALCALLDAGCDLALLAGHSEGTALQWLLFRHRHYARELERPLTHVPEMVRLLVGAGCPVDGKAGELGQGAASVLQAWLNGLRPSSGVDAYHAHWPGIASLSSQRRWPVALTAETLAVSAELLRPATPTPQLGGASYLLDAIMIGDLRLVGLVLDAFPQSVLLPEGQSSTELSSVVGCACHVLCDRMTELGWYCESSVEWELNYAAPVLHGYKLVAMVLAAGAPPQKVVVADEESPEAVTWMEWGDSDVAFLPQELVPLPGPPLTLWVPPWALGPLSFLPLAASGIEWSPQHHVLFPPAFRRAARTLLLVNECRMAGGAALVEFERIRLEKPRRSTFLSRLLGRKPRRAIPVEAPTLVGPASLPTNLLHHVLLLASRPLPAWVPELAPFVQQAGLE